MKNLKLSIRLFLGVGILFLAIVAVVLISFANSNKLIESSNWIVHTHQVLSKLNHIEKTLVDLETGQRGYIISGDENYLEPYNRGLLKIENNLTELEKLTSDNISQTKRLKVINELVEDKMLELNQTINLRRDKGFEEAKQIVITNLGKQIMDDIRYQITLMKDEELRLLRLRSIAPEQARKSTNRIMIYLLIFSIVMGSVITILFIRSIIKPVKILQEGTIEVGKGNLNYKFNNASKDEIGQLSRAFNTMLDNLKTITTSKDKLVIEMENRKKAEEKLEAHNQQLRAIEQQLRAANQQLEASKKKLQESNKDLQQFAYVASHDLKEPLRMVSSYIQLLERRYKDKLDDKAKKYINYAVDGANRMQTLIDNLLSFSRISTQGDEFVKTDVNRLLQDAKKSMKTIITKRKAVITNDKLPEVLADKTQLERLFANLIGNAIKYCDKKPEIHISAQKTKNEWLFSVQDNGIGIDKEFSEKVFIIFQRLHTKDEYTGTGIGLAISKRIINRHGGEIWFESEPGKGTTFYFSLPVKNK